MNSPSDLCCLIPGWALLNIFS